MGRITALQNEITVLQGKLAKNNKEIAGLRKDKSTLEAKLQEREKTIQELHQAAAEKST